MALRSALRKMPALGFRSPPMGPLMGPVRALSPAAGCRLMSHGAPGGETIHFQGTLAEHLAESDKKWAELHMRWAEHERRTAAEFDKNMEIYHQEMASAEAHYNEVVRQSSEDLSSFMKKMHIVGKTCNVLNVVFPVTAILITIGVSM